MGSTIQNQVSSRLRKVMKNNDLIYPDERGELNPYSLICEKCGNAKIFYYDEIKRTLITIVNGIISCDFGRFIQKSRKRNKVSIIVKKHMETGAGISREIDITDEDIFCANCGKSGAIVLYGDMLAECQDNRCTGCFMCGGAYNEENIIDTCARCIEYRKEVARDPIIFMITLDMDLFCDACPLQAIREEYNIDADSIKAEAGGKLK